MIPESKQIPVKKALQTAFGVNQYDSIHPIEVGLSNALTYRIVVRNKPYLIKLVSTNEMNSPIKHFDLMKVAAEMELAPRVLYLNSEEGIFITDFIESRAFPISKAKEVMPKLLGRLHKLPAFKKTVNYFDAMDGLVQRFQAAKLISDNLIEEIMENYARIKNVYPVLSEDFVSSHNDLKPENIMFDGERAWLVDWEAAFLNDRYVDLAVVGNFVIQNDGDALQYLQEYFGEAPSQYVQARFYLMQQLLHVFYLSIFILYASKSVPIKIENVDTNFVDFHQSMWEGKIDLSNDGNKLKYGIVHMNQFLFNIHTHRFEHSLSIISNN